MSTLLWLMILLPFAGALILAVFGAYMPKRAVGAIACTTVGLSWVLAMIADGRFLSTGGAGRVDSVLYPWMDIDGLRVPISLRLDSLSLVYMLVVTFVAFLIHLYAAQSMYDEDGYSRFFAYMNLFVGSMLVLVMAGNLLFLYLGWEGVGLCSYLLIGFWYKDPANGHAAQKAFIVTRVGDTALALGFFLLYKYMGTLDVETILRLAPAVLTAGSATAIAFLFIGGAIGKSAQIPLQTWLPDAMAGPTPVSALIHAATMVTAGVYLIARMHTVFEMSPTAMFAVALIGTITLLYAGITALFQTDIKRVLAYSTMSQIGYMFLALGVGAWMGAIFHFYTHAFFKALLFLSAGIVIDALHEEHNIFKMGGLRTKLPVAFWTFLIGTASLSAIPFVTAGFYSKDAILWAAWSSNLGSVWFWLGGMVGALITSAYSFRVLFLAFFGEPKQEVHKHPGALMKLSVIVLSVFAVVAGFIRLPAVLGGFDPFGRVLSHVLPTTPEIPARSGSGEEWLLIVISSIVAIIGIVPAYIYFRRPEISEAASRSRGWRALHQYFFAGWGFDWLYDHVFVRPFHAIAQMNSADFVDKFFVGLAGAAKYLNLGLSATQTGRLRNYAVGIIIGAVIVAAIVLLR